MGYGQRYTATEAGTYTLVARSEGRCTVSAGVSITEDFSPPSAGNGGWITVCTSDAPFSLFDRLTALGGKPSAGGTWSLLGYPVADRQDPTGMLVGTYTYTVGEGSTCTPSSSTLEIVRTEAAAYYLDADGDGFGDASQQVTLCQPQSGYVTNGADCDDTDARRHPGAAEGCDGIDNDCDGAVDEDEVCTPTGFSKRTNAGGPAVTLNGVAFEADNSYTTGFSYVNSQMNVPTLYQTVRASNTPQYVIYRFPLEPGEYVVKLHFAEPYYGAPGGGTGGRRVSDVVVENQLVLNNYDIIADVGPNKAVVKEFRVTNSNDEFFMYVDGRTYYGNQGTPLINGLEVISVNGSVLPNLAPVAVATASPASGTAPLAVVLDGTASGDADGAIVAYNWTWSGGSFSGPSGLVNLPEGSYTFTLTVTDEDGATGTDQVTVNVTGSVADADGDGIADALDNCPTIYNPEQTVATYYADQDKDGYGDPNTIVQDCRPPSGYVDNALDLCPFVFDGTTPRDTDGDGAGDACDEDDDNDGVPDADDCAPLDAAFGTRQLWYADGDGDGFGDPGQATYSCAAPTDYVANHSDNCPTTYNPGQEDSDGDGTGDACPDAGLGTSSFWLEAECAAVGSVWTVRTATDASGGKYVDALGNYDLRNVPADVPANRVRFTLTGARAGVYHLFARVRAPNPDSDSYWYRVNGGEWVRWSGGIVADNVLNWNRYRGTLNLTQGENVLDFAWREGAAQLDKIHLDVDATVPTGLGDPATNCSGNFNERPVAVARVSATSGLAPLSVTLDGSGSYDQDGRIATYVWNWKGGQATGEKPRVTFPAGSYEITLTVIDNRGAASTDRVPVLSLDAVADTDGDGIADHLDNCPATYNPDQHLPIYYADFDGDNFGDPNEWVRACQPPARYVSNGTDNCPFVSNPDQSDANGNGVGDACEGVTYRYREFWLEAECGEAGSNWLPATDGSASGDGYVHAPRQSSMSSPPADVAANRVRFIVTDAKAGTYHVFGLIHAPNADSDSYWIRSNDGAWFSWSSGIRKTGGFSWNQMRGTLDLIEGANVIDVAFREGGSQLDKLHLDLDPTVPVGLGETADNCNGNSNVAPLAVAGSSAYQGAAPLAVMLDGSASSDLDGSIASYSWTWTGGSAAGAKPTVTFPAGRYDVTLTVTDHEGETGTAILRIESLDVDTDSDGDGIADAFDNCPTVANPGQALHRYYADFDGDGLGDPADMVEDCVAPADFVANADDNCPSYYSTETTDSDGDGIGDACDDFFGVSADVIHEAECAVTGSGWRSFYSADASGGNYLKFVGDHHFGVPSMEDARQQVVFNMDITTAATYYLYLRMNAPDGGRNSLWVRVDDGPWIKFWKTTRLTQILTKGFEWHRVQDDLTPVSFALPPGAHRITVANREAGTEFDKVLLTNIDTAPAGEGGTAVNCGAAPAAAISWQETPAAGVFETATGVTAYPNPTRGALSLEVSSPFRGAVSVRVFDLTGRMLRERGFLKESARLQTSLDVTGIPAGVYRLETIEGESRTVTPFVKLR